MVTCEIVLQFVFVYFLCIYFFNKLGFTKMFSVFNIYHFITNIFKKRNTENINDSDDRFSTPPRAPSRAAKREFKDGNLRGRRPSNNPKCPPSRLKPFPLIRNPSEISLLGTVNKETPFKQADVMRIRGSSTNLQGAVNEAFDFAYPEQRAMNARRGSSVLDFQDIPSNKNSNSTFGYYSATEDRSNDTLDFGEDTTSRRLRLSNHHSGPGIPANMNGYNLTDTGVHGRKFNSLPPYLRSRMPEACPLTRTPSQASLLGSNLNKCTPFRTKGMTRARGSSTNLRNLANNSFDMNFSELDSISTKREDLDFCDVPTHKESKPAFECHSAAGDQANMQPNDASECHEVLTTRQLQLRSNPHSAPGYSLPYKHVFSKIPIRNLGRYVSPKPTELIPYSQRYRGRHTLTATKRNSYGMSGIEESENILDTTGMKLDISNWIAFRNDTSFKFERVFKSLSKKKHHSTGNIIDSSSHVQWLMLAGISVDKDASTFKNFAGGKVVLTFGEYKFLIHKICEAHDLDYWDVLRKMATFQEELHHEDGAAFL